MSLIHLENDVGWYFELTTRGYYYARPYDSAGKISIACVDYLGDAPIYKNRKYKQHSFLFFNIFWGNRDNFEVYIPRRIYQMHPFKMCRYVSDQISLTRMGHTMQVMGPSRTYFPVEVQ